MHTTVQQMVQQGKHSRNGTVSVDRDFSSGQPANQTLISLCCTQWICSVFPPQLFFFLLRFSLLHFSPNLGLSCYSVHSLSCLHSSHRLFIDVAMPDRSKEKVLSSYTSSFHSLVIPLPVAGLIRSLGRLLLRLKPGWVKKISVGLGQACRAACLDSATVG